MNALESEFIRLPDIHKHDVASLEAVKDGGGGKVTGIGHRGLL
jgi:hypothetical protein